MSAAVTPFDFEDWYKDAAIRQYWQEPRQMAKAAFVAGVQSALAAPVQPAPHNLIGSTDGVTTWVDKPNPPVQPVPAAPPDPQLCKFYKVETFPALVEAQARHVEKMQSKLISLTGTFTAQKVREG